MPTCLIVAPCTLLFQLAAANLIAAEPRQRTAIVVAAPAYRHAMDSWVQRRRGQGFEVEVINPLDVIGSHRGADAVERLRDAIERRATLGGVAGDSDPETFVLLPEFLPADHQHLYNPLGLCYP